MGHCTAPVGAYGIGSIVAVEVDVKKDYESRITRITSWALVLALLVYLILGVIEKAKEVFL